MKLNAPYSDEYVIGVAKKIFEPISRGESTFCRFFPGHGKSVRLRQILANPKFLKAGMGDIYGKLVIVAIDTYDYAVDPLNLYFVYVKRELIKSLRKLGISLNLPKSSFKDKDTSLVYIVEEIFSLTDAANEAGYKVIFIIDVSSHSLPKEIELYSAWARIVEHNLNSVHTHIDSETSDLIDKGTLPAVLIQSLVTVALPDRNVGDLYIDYYTKEWNIKLPKKTREKIFEICGNDSWLIKEALRIVRRGLDLGSLRSDPNLILKARIEYELFGKSEKEAVETQLNTGRLPGNLEEIGRKLEEVNFWDKKHHIPSIIEQVIIREQAAGELFTDPKKESLMLGAIDLSKKFAPLELKILIYLYEHKNAVVKREKIADLIWGKEEDEKYSDWAIDKLISRLRARLAQYTSLYRLVTKKGRGFVLEE